MTKKYIMLVVLLFGLGCCSALEDELSYLAQAFNDVARFLSIAVPGGDAGPVGEKPAPGAGKIEGESPVLPGRKVVFTSPDRTVVQRDVDIKEVDKPVGLSGYVSVYYAFSELLRSLKGQEIKMTFDEFKVRALRTIKAYRIEVACRHYIIDQLLASLVPEEEFATRKWGFKISSSRMRGIYHSLISDLASIQAKRYVKVNYDPKKDTLQPSSFEVQGKALIADIAEVVRTRIDRYVEESEKKIKKKESNIQEGMGTQRSAISNNLNDVNLFEQVTKINPQYTLDFTSREVLTELHSKQSFGNAEGFIAKPAAVDLESLMPKGYSLGSDEVEHLLWDWKDLKDVGLTSAETKANTTIFDSLNLLDVNWGDLLVHFMGRTLNNLYSFLGVASVQEIQSFFATQDIQDIANLFGEDPKAIEAKFTVLAKPDYYRDNLQAIVKRSQGKVHVFVVNVDYDYRNPFAMPNWVDIVRYPNKQYVVVDVSNKNRIDDINVQLIKQAFGD